MTMQAEAPTKTMSNYRWRICALVFFATTINYLDRNVLGLLKEDLSKELGWTETDYSHIVMTFQIAYAVGLLFVGGIIDRIGTKKGYAYSLFGWSIAAIGHAFAHSTFTFGAARAALGVTEAGNFPAANKTVAEWFPKKERALATGVYNSGANIGAILAPLTVPYIAWAWGWEWAFIITGAVGLVWLYFWKRGYGTPEEKMAKGCMNQAEIDYIQSDLDEVVEDKAERVKWVKLLNYKQTWAFFFGKFFTDPIWWFFLFWLPAFLKSEGDRRPDYAIEWPVALAVIYTVATFGSIYGGWLPKYLINKGMSANKARKLSMFLYALVPLSVLGASSLGEINTWYAVAVISLACAAHQAWSANIFATVSDMFPKKAIASVTGLGGMAGSAGAILIAWGAGQILDHYKLLGQLEVGYGIMFIICSLGYIVAWCIMQILVPKFKQIQDL